jgi:hypothetical protein
MTATDLPPTRTIDPIDQPPDSDNPTMAMLKADINSGATGDKTEVFDPGMAMLGTCEEAAGTPLRPDQIALARRYETFQRWIRGSRRAGAAHNKKDGFPTFFVGFIVAVGVVLATALPLVWS